MALQAKRPKKEHSLDVWEAGDGEELVTECCGVLLAQANTRPAETRH